MKAKIIVITGPTATGKTRLSVELAKEFNGEIISADSMQLYRRMDIGTAKVTDEEKCGIPHHMIDVAEPDEAYSVARYVQEADACISDILARGKVPIIAGGTNLYIDSLIAGRDFAENESDNSLRDQLLAEYDLVGGEKMLETLRGFDPDRAEKLHPADKRRIVRAIEVYRLTGKTITEHDEETKRIPPKYDAAMIALDYEDRAELYARIDMRVDEMVDAGLFDEVKSLLDAGLSAKSTAMQAIGYKEIVSCLKGEISSAEASELIKQSSRRYAKRQLTWFGRRTEALRLFHEDAPSGDLCPEAIKKAKEFLI